jgi:hypothetical protein
MKISYSCIGFRLLLSLQRGHAIIPSTTTEINNQFLSDPFYKEL